MKLTGTASPSMSRYTCPSRNMCKCKMSHLCTFWYLLKWVNNFCFHVVWCIIWFDVNVVFFLYFWNYRLMTKSHHHHHHLCQGIYVQVSGWRTEMESYGWENTLKMFYDLILEFFFECAFKSWVFPYEASRSICWKTCVL